MRKSQHGKLEEKIRERVMESTRTRYRHVGLKLHCDASQHGRDMTVVGTYWLIDIDMIVVEGPLGIALRYLTKQHNQNL